MDMPRQILPIQRECCTLQELIENIRIGPSILHGKSYKNLIPPVKSIGYIDDWQPQQSIQPRGLSDISAIGPTFRSMPFVVTAGSTGMTNRHDFAW